MAVAQGVTVKFTQEQADLAALLPESARTGAIRAAAAVVARKAKKIIKAEKKWKKSTGNLERSMTWTAKYYKQTGVVWGAAGADWKIGPHQYVVEEGHRKVVFGTEYPGEMVAGTGWLKKAADETERQQEAEISKYLERALNRKAPTRRKRG